jgi:hypothetical protein
MRWRSIGEWRCAGVMIRQQISFSQLGGLFDEFVTSM